MFELFRIGGIFGMNWIESRKIVAIVVCVGGCVYVYGLSSVTAHIRSTWTVPLTRDTDWAAFGTVHQKPLKEVGKAGLKKLVNRPKLYDLSVFGGRKGTGKWVVVYHLM